MSADHHIPVYILFVSYDENLKTPEVKQSDDWTADLTDLQNAWRFKCFERGAHDKTQSTQYSWTLLTLQTILDENPNKKLAIKNWTAKAADRRHFTRQHVFYNYLTFVVVFEMEYWLFGKNKGRVYWKQGMNMVQESSSILKLLRSFEEENKLYTEGGNYHTGSPLKGLWISTGFWERKSKVLPETQIVDCIKAIFAETDAPKAVPSAPWGESSLCTSLGTFPMGNDPYPWHCARDRTTTTVSESATTLLPQRLLEGHLPAKDDIPSIQPNAINLLLQALAKPGTASGQPLTYHQRPTLATYKQPTLFTAPKRCTARLNSEEDCLTSMSESEEDENAAIF